MKILHVNASYKPAFVYGGTTVSVAELCESFDSATIDVICSQLIFNIKKQSRFVLLSPSKTSG